MTDTRKKLEKTVVIVTIIVVNTVFISSQYFQTQVLHQPTKPGDIPWASILIASIIPTLFSNFLTDIVVKLLLFWKQFKQFILHPRYIDGWFYVEWYDKNKNNAYVGNELTLFQFNSDLSLLIEKSINFVKGYGDPTDGDYTYYKFNKNEFIGRFSYNLSNGNEVVGYSSCYFFTINDSNIPDIYKADVEGWDEHFREFHSGKIISKEEINRYKRRAPEDDEWKRLLLHDYELKYNRVRGQNYTEIQRQL